ncbi:transposase [Streptomyces sp. MCAF7]
MSEGIPKTVVGFAALDCIPCPFKPQCTTAKKNRRQLSLHPRQMTEALRRARTRHKTKDWNTDYALRSGIEGTIRQATAVTGTRHARYRGMVSAYCLVWPGRYV